jgi:uncharacterized membrane protein
MTHNILSLDTSPRTLAHVEEVASGQPWRWLAAGWRDLRRAPGPSLGYGLLFVVASYLITLAVILNQLFYLLLPLATGFFLIAPALGIGLYEVSRALEQGETPTFRGALRAILANGFNVTTMGAFLAVIFLAWILVANLIFAGLSSGITPTLPHAVQYLLSAQNLPMLIVGSVVGAVFALIVFALSAVSVPMLLDRPDVALPSAMQVSAAACLYNWRPMLLWAALIGISIFAGFLTLYVGLALAFPLIGHATWHAYRDLVRT